MRILATGMLVGTPVLYAFTVVLASVAGVGVANAFAIAAIPALFGGITFGGFVPLMLHLARQDKIVAEARTASRRAVATRQDELTALAAA